MNLNVENHGMVWNNKWAIRKKAFGKTPKVLCVVCGLSNAAYKRTDGVYVVPITALKP